MTRATMRRHPTPPALTSPSRPLADALEYLCLGECTLAVALGVTPEELAEIRRGTRVLTLPQALTVVRRLREQAAVLQLAAEAAAEAVQADVARLACAAYEQAMQAPDREGAVETALQVLFDVSA